MPKKVRIVLEIEAPPGGLDLSDLQLGVQALLRKSVQPPLRDAKVLGAEIVPADEPTAAGDGFSRLDSVLYAEEFFNLQDEQRNRVAMLLKDWMAPMSVNILVALLSRKTNTLIAFIQFQDDSTTYRQWYIQTLLPGTVDFIFG